MNDHRPGVVRVRAHRRRLAFALDRISRVAQLGSNLAGGKLLAGTHFAGSRIDLRRVFKQRMLQTGIDNALVFEPVKAEDTEEEDKSRRDNDRRSEEELTVCDNRRPGYFDLYCQVKLPPSMVLDA